MRNRALIGLCAVAVAVIAAELLVASHGADDEPVSAPAPEVTRTTGAFVDSIGVGVHLGYGDTSYADTLGVIARLRELGVRHIRDGVPFAQPAVARGLRLAAAAGIHATLITDLTTPPGTLPSGPAVDAVEAPNELDHFGPPDWRRRIIPYLRALKGALAGPPLVGPSFADPQILKGVDPRLYDLASLHPYAGGEAPEDPLRQGLAIARVVAPGKPVLFTETGYHNALAATAGQPPASERAAAIYLPRTLLWAFNAGVRRTFIYELADEKPDPARTDPEQHFGLLRYDLSPKPAFEAVRNLIAALDRSPGPSADRPGTPEVQTRAAFERVALERPDHSRVMAIWRPVSVWHAAARRDLDPGRELVTLRWPAAVRDVSVTRPSLGPAPLMSVSSTDRLRLELAGDVVLVSYR